MIKLDDKETRLLIMSLSSMLKSGYNDSITERQEIALCINTLASNNAIARVEQFILKAIYLQIETTYNSDEKEALVKLRDKLRDIRDKELTDPRESLEFKANKKRYEEITERFYREPIETQKQLFLHILHALDNDDPTDLRCLTACETDVKVCANHTKIELLELAFLPF